MSCFGVRRFDSRGSDVAAFESPDDVTDRPGMSQLEMRTNEGAVDSLGRCDVHARRDERSHPGNEQDVDGRARAAVSERDLRERHEHR